MKYNNKLSSVAILAGAALMGLTSCADEFDANAYIPTRPGTEKDYAYLNDYKPLKEYLDRSAHPNFKVSAALTASDFSQKGMLYSLALSNFDEIVAGNAMKMASIVDDKGNMTFDNVSAFVEAAQEAGLTVFGHTLLWHEQQPYKYLNTLIKDKEMPKTEGETKIEEQEVASVSYTDGAFPFYPMGCEPPVQNGALHFVPTGDWSQFFISNAIALEAGDYAVILSIQSSVEGSIKLTTQNGWSDAQQLDGNVALTTEMSEVTVKFPGLVGGNYDFILKPETFGGTLDVKGFRVIKYNEVAAGPAMHTELQQVAQTTYTDGSFPFYPMGCEPPVIDGALHFVPTGDWSQFFITNAISLEAGNYVAKLRIKSSLEGSIKLTTQNGWGSDAQQLDGSVKLTTDWTDVEISYNELVGGNYDFILKPETFGGTLDVQSLTIYKAVEVAGPVAKEVAKTTYTDGGFPFYPMGCEPPVIDGALHFEPTGDWSQFFITNAIALEAGDYTAILRIKASKEGSIKLTTQNGWSDAQQLDGNVKLTTDWADVEIKYDGLVGGNYDFILKPETFDAVLDVQSLTIVKYEEYQEPAAMIDKKFTEKKRTIVVTTADLAEYAWDSQFWIMTSGFSEGDSYEFSCDVRADIDASASTQVHNDPGAYVHYEGVGNVSFTPDWETYSSTGSLKASGRSIAFNLNETKAGTKYYFRNFSFKVNGVEMIPNGDLSADNVDVFYSKEYAYSPTEIFASKILDEISYTKQVASNTIPLTEEEKTVILSAYMDKYFTAMMQATDGKVKAWDLINEPMDGEGNLQTGGDDPGAKFYWQDHMGAANYGVCAARAARKAYAAVEGTNPDDLKLFINDYNLEWQTAKLDGLIAYVKQLNDSADVKIDGIGSQMHISMCLDEKDYENQKKGITEMLTKMAATGLLVRISEIDMGVVDKQWGDAKKTGEITFEQEKKMADFYEWIIAEYFRVVPSAQQYGICQWCITDAPASSGWRPGEPVGLWTEDYLRKPAYAGWAAGLQK